MLTLLDDHLAAVRRADAAVAEAETHERTSRRAIDRAAAPLRDYHEQVGAQEREPDADHERQLLSELHAAQAAVTARPAYTSDRDTGVARMIGLDFADVRAEAALAGARRALEARRSELTTFVAEHLDELAAARVPQSQQAGSRMAVALESLDAADAQWREESRWWAQLGRLAGDRGQSLGELAPNPANGVAVGRPAAPLPAGLLASLQEVTA